MIETHLAELRKLQDPKHWPLTDDDVWLIIDGEIYAFMRSDDAFEERVFKPLYR